MITCYSSYINIAPQPVHAACARAWPVLENRRARLPAADSERQGRAAGVFHKYLTRYLTNKMQPLIARRRGAMEARIQHERNRLLGRSASVLDKVRGMERDLRLRERDMRRHKRKAAEAARHIGRRRRDGSIISAARTNTARNSGPAPAAHQNQAAAAGPVVAPQVYTNQMRTRIKRGVASFQASLRVATSQPAASSSWRPQKNSLRTRRSARRLEEGQAAKAYRKPPTNPIVAERQRIREQQEALQILAACTDHFEGRTASGGGGNALVVLTPVQRRFLSTLRDMVTSVVVCRRTLALVLFRFVPRDDLKHPDLAPVLAEALAAVDLSFSEFDRSIRTFG